jgi:transcriptional regulator with XRE-family HTH domain
MPALSTRLTVAPVVSLREARRRRALSLREVAQAAGVSPKTAWRIDHGKSVPLPRVRRQLAEALRVDPQLIHWPERSPA